MARVVAEPAALEDRQPLLIDTERRRAVSDDRATRNVLEHRARPDDVVAKLAQGELHRHDVAVAVTGDLVAARGDLADERRLALGDPAEHEEGRANLVLGEQPQHAARGARHPPRDRLPAVGRKQRPEVLDLEPVLDVEGQEARNHTRRYPMWRNCSASARPGNEW